MVCVPMIFHLGTFVCWLKEKRGMGVWALGEMEKASGHGGIFSRSSRTVEFFFHISICFKESRVSARTKSSS